MKDNHKQTYVVTVHWNCSSVLPSADCNIQQYNWWNFTQQNPSKLHWGL